jgi:hypothetical protein
MAMVRSPGRVFPLITACAVAAGLLGGITSPERGSSTTVGEEERARVLEDYAQAPLSFEENRGQTDPRVRYLTRGRGYTLYLTEQEAVFSLSGAHAEPGALGPAPAPPGAALRMVLVGADPVPGVVGQSGLPGVVSYFKGSNPEGWQAGIPTFARVRYQDVYPRTDLVFRGTRQALEYDFLLAPGADPGRIALRFEGAEDLRIDPDGDLIITTAVGELVHRAPVVYQEVEGDREDVRGEYRLHGDHVRFAVGAYNPALPLVIDPVVLRYSTFLGGSGLDEGLGIAVDGYTRQAYVTGMTNSTEFPTTAGAFDQTHNGSNDAYVTKLGPTGASLSYSTFLGGSGFDGGTGIAVDGIGSAYVTGFAQEADTDFPTTVGAFDRTNGGIDAFVTKLDPTGVALSYSTFLGGRGVDRGLGIAVNGLGAAYITGQTDTGGFPTTGGAFDQTQDAGFDAFVTKLGPTGASLSYSTFLGGSGHEVGFGIAVDGFGAAYATGETDAANFPTTGGALDQTQNAGFDVFVTKLGPTGGTLSYSTFLGGSGDDRGSGIAVDGVGTAYVTGFTEDHETDFPTTAGAFDQTHNGGFGELAFDAFVAKLGPVGDSLSYSTFLGGSGFDEGSGIAVDGGRAAYVTGDTERAATNFPTTAGAFDQTHNGFIDAFVTKLGATGDTLSHSTFLGGSGIDNGMDIAVDGARATYVTGDTTSADIRTTPGAFDRTHNGGFDAFVAKLVEPTPPPPPGSTLACRGRTATLVGTVGEDSITGTPGRDVIVALAGGDVVKALDGGDVICAGQGKDTATGGGGKDRVQGEDGKDRLRGGSGNDTLSGGNGKDACLAGSGQNVAHNCEKERSIP